jgi:hypothetical protein
VTSLRKLRRIDRDLPHLVCRAFFASVAAGAAIWRLQRGPPASNLALNDMYLARCGKTSPTWRAYVCNGSFMEAMEWLSPARPAQTYIGHAPWSTLSWGVFIPAVFAGNVVLAIFAWFVVEWITKLI